MNLKKIMHRLKLFLKAVNCQRILHRMFSLKRRRLLIKGTNNLIKVKKRFWFREIIIKSKKLGKIKRFNYRYNKPVTRNNPLKLIPIISHTIKTTPPNHLPNNPCPTTPSNNNNITTPPQQPHPSIQYHNLP